MLAVNAGLAAFRREGPLQRDGRYYKMSPLGERWASVPHNWEDIKIDISAVGPIMGRESSPATGQVKGWPSHRSAHR